MDSGIFGVVTLASIRATCPTVLTVKRRWRFYLSA
ncbi:hypothetical protein LMG28614_04253 [Paraburkholderia ultramafica]|uniref:Uncharacterized protein n=1 Tax=Paraburkholderia ultramafica TaxID=1544867 RepID=A0A6S7BM44_9BURK|nr:hypothetical protein LMG28614_04253 [Paraburkholderia ultramafica]